MISLLSMQGYRKIDQDKFELILSKANVEKCIEHKDHYGNVYMNDYFGFWIDIDGSLMRIHLSETNTSFTMNVYSLHYGCEQRIEVL